MPWQGLTLAVSGHFRISFASTIQMSFPLLLETARPYPSFQ
jgi:hypothetical protein